MSWTRPADEGGRTDLYYQVEHSDPDRICSYTGTLYLSRGSMTRTRTFTGLRPGTSYCVRVIAHNGVSDQDPDGTHLRTVEDCATTDEGSKSLVKDTTCKSMLCRLFIVIMFYAAPGPVTGLGGAYPYVVWGPPQQSNGVITRYRLIFTRAGSSATETHFVNHDMTSFTIGQNDIPWTSGSFSVIVSI